MYKFLEPVITGIFNIDVYKDLIKRWNEEHRFYHNINHLEHMLSEIEKLFSDKKIDNNERIILITIAFFHDAIYDPKSNTNEEDSVEYFIDCMRKKHNTNNLNDYEPFIKQVKLAILDTKRKDSPTDKLSKIIWSIDNSIFGYDMSTLIEYEHEIYKEYQFADYREYQKKRIEFLHTRIGMYSDVVDKNLKSLIEYVKDRQPRIGIFAGSFNPFHIGHYDVLLKAEKIFDKVIIGFGNNPDKPDRDVIIPNKIKNRECIIYDSLITDVILKQEGYNQNVSLIRGIRNGNDLDYEANQLAFIKDIKPDVNVIYIPTDKKYEHISSSAIKALMKFDKEKAKKYLL